MAFGDVSVERRQRLRAEEEGREPHWPDLAVVEELVGGGHRGRRWRRAARREVEIEVDPQLAAILMVGAGSAARGARRRAVEAAGGGERRVAGGAGRRADEGGGARAFIPTAASAGTVVAGVGGHWAGKVVVVAGGDGETRK